MPEKSKESVASIANYILQKKFSTVEKVRGIYDFETTFISYDMETAELAIKNNFQGGDITQQQLPVHVLKSKKAICEGYSKLFQSICDSLHIECFTVLGYGFKDAKSPPLNHGWNIVWVENEWKFIDATFGSGAYDPESKTYKKEAIDTHFFTPVDEMQKNHFPIFPYFQLRKYPIKFDYFLRHEIKNTTSTPISFSDSLNELYSKDTLYQWEKMYFVTKNFEPESKPIQAFNDNSYRAYIFNHHTRNFNSEIQKQQKLISQLNSLVSGKTYKNMDAESVNKLILKLKKVDNSALASIVKMKIFFNERMNEFDKMETSIKTNLSYLENLKNQLDKATK
jgi:hypothetical protein